MDYVCNVCGWVYVVSDGLPEKGIAPATNWQDVPEDFLCPVCNVNKDQFSKNGVKEG